MQLESDVIQRDTRGVSRYEAVEFTSISVNGLPDSLLVAWINRSRKLPGLQPDLMLTSCLPLAWPLAVPLAVLLAAASRARVSWIS